MYNCLPSSKNVPVRKAEYNGVLRPNCYFTAMYYGIYGHISCVLFVKNKVLKCEKTDTSTKQQNRTHVKN